MAAEQAVRAAITRKFGNRVLVTLDETVAVFDTTEAATWAIDRRGHLPTITINGRRGVPVDLLIEQFIVDGQRSACGGDAA